jgi:hypothetical protein
MPLVSKIIYVKKFILWALAIGAIVIGGFFSYEYWKLSRKWIGVIYLESDSFSHKEVGEFSGLNQCRAAAETVLRTNPTTDNGTKANRYFCGRACLIDAFVGQVATDEYQCAEKHFSDGTSN